MGARARYRRGQDWLGPELGVPARAVSRVLRRHRMPYLREPDPITGVIIGASKTTGVRYEHDHPGSLVHTNVKKLGRIPEGGGWKLHGRSAGDTAAHMKAKIGYDFVTHYSMTIPATPIPRSSSMRRARPPPPSWPGPWTTSPASGSSWND